MQDRASPTPRPAEPQAARTPAVLAPVGPASELPTSFADAGLATATLHASGAAAGDDPPFRLNASGMLALQRMAGNQAVVAAMRSLKAPAPTARPLQRVLVQTGDQGETLYNQTGPGGKAGAAHYGGEGKYELERQADTGASVTIKIKFIRQHRNTLPPPPGSKTAPKVGQLTGPESEIPDGDRGWARDTAAAAMNHWNGKVLFVATEDVAPEGGAAGPPNRVDKRLPVTFKAEPVFDLAASAHQTVVVHPANVVGGSTGNPIDAGNYYMKKDEKKYPVSDDVIYAHEYGHLMGINDEYSQSNEQINLLLHQAAPANAASLMAALDKQTIETMTLAALSRPLRARLDAAMPAVTSALRAQRALVKGRMSTAAAEGVQADSVREWLTDRLLHSTTANLDPKIPDAIAFQTTKNFGSKQIAGSIVEQTFATGALSTRIAGSYRQAIRDTQTPVDVPGFGKVSINVQESVFTAAQGKSALAGSAKGIAGAQIGPAARPGIPEVAPSDTLVGKLAAVPGTWSSAGSALESAISGANFATKMAAVLQAASVAAVAAEEAAPAGKRPSKAATTKALNALAYKLVQNAAREAARQLTVDLLDSQLTPVMRQSVADLQAAIAAEVTRVTSMTPAELAAAAAPDPAMAAIVTGMKARLDEAKRGLGGTGMDPLGVPGGKSPAQDVTYSYQGLMGSSRGGSKAMRVDQFHPMVGQFNTHLKKPTEADFKVELT